MMLDDTDDFGMAAVHHTTLTATTIGFFPYAIITQSMRVGNWWLATRENAANLPGYSSYSKAESHLQIYGRFHARDAGSRSDGDTRATVVVLGIMSLFGRPCFSANAWQRVLIHNYPSNFIRDEGMETRHGYYSTL
jgi:hypothetical protein